MNSLRYLRVKNFLSLKDVEVRLGDLNVLVGPNGSGKSNLLNVFRFLGETARDDLGPAVSRFGGFAALRFRGKRDQASLSIELKATVTRYVSEGAPDEYRLTFWSNSKKHRVLSRWESFCFKRTAGRGRRITLNGGKFSVVPDDPRHAAVHRGTLQASSAGLSVLRKLGQEASAPQWKELAELFLSLRVFEPDVAAARRPAARERTPRLASDASNLAAYLAWLREEHRLVFRRLVDDLRRLVPSVRALKLHEVGGSSETVVVRLKEHALEGHTDLAHASFGTVRALATLAMLHDPAPPKLTLVEEIDHGLHPWALDIIVDRLRSASRRTQLLLATHSPALVNRLRPEEIIVCERDQTSGASIIPAISPAKVRAISAEDELALGELWFSGTLGGVLD